MYYPTFDVKAQLLCYKRQKDKFKKGKKKNSCNSQNLTLPDWVFLCFLDSKYEDSKWIVVEFQLSFVKQNKLYSPEPHLKPEWLSLWTSLSFYTFGNTQTQNSKWTELSSSSDL